jgi:hypothetical protein
MLHRSIPIREVLVHSFLISEVKDMKSDVVRAVKASQFGKKTLNLVCGLNFNNFQEKKLHRLCISFYNISTVGINIFKIHLKFFSNPVFPFITYPLIPLLLIDLFEV